MSEAAAANGSPSPAPEAPAAELAQLALEDEAAPKVSFSDQFKAFSKFGDTKSDGKLITLAERQVDEAGQGD